MGLNKSVPATCFPTAATVANSWNTKLGEEIGACLGVEAGAHLEMPSTGGDSDEELIKAVKEGTISEEILNQRVRELLKVVMEVRTAVDAQKGSSFNVEAHHAITGKAAEESIVLLKNEKELLPLKPGTKVAVIGEFAANPRYQGAGWQEACVASTWWTAL